MEKLIEKILSMFFMLFKLLKIYLILVAIGVSITVGVVAYNVFTDPLLTMAVGEQESISLENYNDYLYLNNFSFVYRTEYGDPYYSPSNVRWLIQRCDVLKIDIGPKYSSNRSFILEDLRVEFTIDTAYDFGWDLDLYGSLLSENGTIVLYQRNPFNQLDRPIRFSNRGIRETLPRKKCSIINSRGQEDSRIYDVKYTFTNVEGIIKRVE